MENLLFSPALLPLVESAYDIFSRYKLYLPLHCCGCERCVTPDMQLEIVHTPLRTLEVGFLHSWEESAFYRMACEYEKGLPLDDDWYDEVRSFIPRIMEVMALGEDPTCDGVENAFRTAALADWQNWPEKERDILIRFVEAFFLFRLSIAEFSTSHIGYVFHRDLDATGAVGTLLVMGFDTDRIIDLWRQAPDPLGAVYLAEARKSVRYDWEDGVHVFSSIWSEDHVANTRLGQWLAGSEVVDRLEAVFFAIEKEDSASQAMRQIISRGLG